MVKFLKAGKDSLQEGARACCASIGLSNAEVEAYLDNLR